ncbi:Inner membrane protein YabI [Planctomycetes bacterium Pan216]|uniref:Inner membrane protein YabI n=1 Tax=Kolteria novifilia TaxID=2527975 RepID=A0A518AZV3_9BACT|nr:Inner membrane protein YabI [Planctomycetes bacterium Pan216]
MDWLEQLDPISIYATIVGMLVVAGVGISPLKEVSFIASGVLLAHGLVSLEGVIVTLSIGVLVGDCTAYMMGRVFGLKLASYPPFRWALTEKHLERVQYEFRKHHVKAIFFGRLIMGVRTVTMIFSGMTRVPLWKFVLLDLAAALVTTPVTVAIAYVVGDPDRVEDLLESFDLILAATVVVILTGIWVAFRYYDRLKAPKRFAEASIPIEEPTRTTD